MSVFCEPPLGLMIREPKVRRTIMDTFGKDVTESGLTHTSDCQKLAAKAVRW
jgi:hypothetical protein